MWTLGGVRIFVQDHSEKFNQVIARLTPLASGTILQIFGYEDIITSLNGYIVGTADRVTLLQYDRSGESYTLSGYGINWGSFYVNSVQLDLIQSNCQTLRPDLPEDSMVTMANIELFKDE